MMSLFRRAAAAAGVLLLAACASTPEIPFERTAQIKTIGVLTPAVANGPSVVLATTVGRSFGLIGALVDISMQENRDTKFKTILADNHFAFNDSFKDSLTASLKAHGYEVVDVPVERKSPNDYLGNYPPSDGHVDAYLDVVVLNYGYIASGISSDSPYRPFVQVRCRLLRASDSSVLMQDAIFYNEVTGSGVYTGDSKMVTLAPDPKFSFVDFDSLTAHPKDATDDLAAAAGETTTALGTLLK